MGNVAHIPLRNEVAVLHAACSTKHIVCIRYTGHIGDIGSGNLHIHRSLKSSLHRGCPCGVGAPFFYFNQLLRLTYTHIKTLDESPHYGFVIAACCCIYNNCGISVLVVVCSTINGSFIQFGYLFIINFEVSSRRSLHIHCYSFSRI